jgi:MFS family permease
MLNAPYPVLRRSALATGAVFALSGAVPASWVSRLPEVRAQLHASPGQLGVALLGASVGSILSTGLSGRLSRRFGSRLVVAAACAVSLLALVGLGHLGSVAELGLVLVLFGLGYGSWDVAMNIHGHGVEASAGRPWMPRYHAAWSVGGFIAAGIGSAAAGARVPVPVHLTVAAVLCMAGVLGALTMFLPDSDRAARPAEPDPGRAQTPRISLLTTAFVLLGVVMAAATLVEGAAADWLGIYFDTVRGTAPAAGAAAFTTFSVAMACSRATGTWTIERLGRSGAVRLSGLLALAGVAVVLLSPVTAGAYVGAAMWGLGTAIVFPAVISAAGDTPGRSADAIAMVTPIGYTGFLVGPPLIGLLAQQVGLQHSLWVVGGLAGLMALLAGATRERARRR